MSIVRIILVLAVLLTASCAWVKQPPGGERIRIAAAEVGDSTRLDSTRVSVRDRVAGVQRKPGKVAEELGRLARASALEMGGDTLLLDGPVRDGARDFIVYRCTAQVN